jgi:hypothetical protein
MHRLHWRRLYRRKMTTLVRKDVRRSMSLHNLLLQRLHLGLTTLSLSLLRMWPHIVQSRLSLGGPHLLHLLICLLKWKNVPLVNVDESVNRNRISRVQCILRGYSPPCALIYHGMVPAFLRHSRKQRKEIHLATPNERYRLDRFTVFTHPLVQ